MVNQNLAKRYTMKKRMLLWTALAVMAWVTIAAAQARTITLDYNYSGAPANITVQTDAHGSLMMPLPSPRRDGQAFNGWFTTATGGNNTMVLAGATGTKFTANTTIYARWSTLTPVNMANIPAAFKENFDWMRFERHNKGIPGYNNGNPELIYFNTNGSVRQRNSVFHMIWEGNGTINWAVRWESGRRITLAERQDMARMLHESINVWTRPLIGMPGWPFGEIQVNLVGWAVRDANVIVDRQPNEVVWVNSTHEAPMGNNNDAFTRDFMASAPREMSRFIQFGGSSRVNTTYNYPGGLHNRFDMYQWCTATFGGAVGGDWGNRLSDTRVIGYRSGVNAQGANTLDGVQTHEVGHSFGLYDLYGEQIRKPPNTTAASPGGQRVFGQGDLTTVMDRTYNGPLNSYDQWQIRYYWDWVLSGTRTAGHAERLFRTSTVTVASTGATGASGGGTYATGQTVIINAGTRSGFTFGGWTVSGAGVTLANANSAITTFAMPANNVTVTANWTSTGTPAAYTLTVNRSPNNNAASALTVAGTAYNGVRTVNANTAINISTTAATGYAFNNWTVTSTPSTAATFGNAGNAATTVTLTGNATIRANFNTVSYTITYNLNSGTQANNPPTSYNITSAAVTLPTPTRAGYTFGGWFENSGLTGTAVTSIPAGSTGNKTYWARWTINSYTVAFRANGGTGTMTSDNVNHGSNYTIKTNTFTRTGYTFTGWNTAATGNATAYNAGAQITNVRANVTLFAQWSINSYTVTFVDGYRTGSEAVIAARSNVNHGTAATAPDAPARTGYTFTGWDIAFTNVTRNLTVTAQWTEIIPDTYAITFNAAGGDVSSSTGITGTNGTLSNLPVPTRTGYTFDGWFTEETAGTEVTTDYVFTEDATIFAQWTEVSTHTVYTVTFNANGGTVDTETATTGANGRLSSLPVPERTGFSFTGWFVDVSDAAGITANYVFTADMTVTAKWNSSTSVLSPDRNPVNVNPKDETESFSPVTVSAGEFTAGPNPVARTAKMVNIYRQGRRVDSGVLTVYDAAGNAVNKIRINDNRTDSQSRRIIGAWDLTDARGRTVSEGTYLVRGAVTVDGKRERVSVMVGVR